MEPMNHIGLDVHKGGSTFPVTYASHVQAKKPRSGIVMARLRVITSQLTYFFIFDLKDFPIVTTQFIAVSPRRNNRRYTFHPEDFPL